MTEGGPEFLADLDLRPVQRVAGASLEPLGLALGQGATPLEVLVVPSVRVPATDARVQGGDEVSAPATKELRDQILRRHPGR